MDLAALDVGQRRVEQRGQRPQDAALRLPAQAQQDEVVPRQDGIHELRHHGVVVTNNAREQRFAPPQLADQVLAHLVFDAAPAQAFFGKFTALGVLRESVEDSSG